MNATPHETERVHQAQPGDRLCLQGLTEKERDRVDFSESCPGATTPPSTGGSSNDQEHAAAWLNLSHELHTPTHAILGYVELLLTGSAGPLSSEMRISLGDIQQAAMQLSAQITEVVKCAEAVSVPESIKPDQPV